VTDARAAGLDALIIDAMHMGALVLPADRQLELNRGTIRVAARRTNYVEEELALLRRR